MNPKQLAQRMEQLRAMTAEQHRDRAMQLYAAPAGLGDRNARLLEVLVELAFAAAKDRS